MDMYLLISLLLSLFIGVLYFNGEGPKRIGPFVFLLFLVWTWPLVLTVALAMVISVTKQDLKQMGG